MEKKTIENHFQGDYLNFYKHYLPVVESNVDDTMALCPFHEDHNPSLSINCQKGLFICYGCGASGSIFDFYAKTHGMALPGDFSKVLIGIALDFNIPNGNGNKQTIKPTVTDRYDYQDESGNLVYQIERLEPKSFRIRQPDGQGWAYNAKGVKIIPYHLPEIMKADEILVVEGEKDTDALAALGFTATTNPFGAGKWPDHFGSYFAGKHVVLIPDNDSQGRLHMHKVAANLKGHAASIKWLELPDIPEKGDVSDWLEKYQDKDEAGERLSIMIESIAVYQFDPSDKEISREEKQRRGFHFLSASDLCASPTVTNWLIKDIMDASSFCADFGESGSFKSFGALDKGLSLACLKDWHGYAIRENGPCFYIAGEGHSGLAQRIKAWSLYHQVDLQGIPFFVSNKAAQFLDDALPVCMAVDELKAINGNPLLVIIDTLSRNFGCGDESQNKDMANFINIIDECVRIRYGCAVLIIHHVGLKEKERMRGASALRAALDWEYLVQKKADGKVIYTCTKCKDHKEPPSTFFETKLVTIDGWVNPDSGEIMTSLVLIRTDGVMEDKKLLSRPHKIAIDTLIAFDSDKGIHIDAWREAAYSAGISSSPKQDTKRKAFTRAVDELLKMKIVKSKGDLWWVI